MKRILLYRFCRILALCCIGVLSLPTGGRCDTCAQWMGKVVSVQGSVEALKAGQTGWQPVELNDTYCPGDAIRVRANSRAELMLRNQSVLRLDENSAITLEGIGDERGVLVDLSKGAAHFFSRIFRSLEVRTPFVTAGVRGTEFLVRVNADQTFLSIFEGAVLASNTAGSLTLAGGQSAVAQAGRAPVLKVVARPRDAVRWALYYPPVIYPPARDVLIGVPLDDARLLSHRASLQLATGRVELAETDIQQALALAPNNSDALSLQAIIALVQNEKEKALKLARQAVAADSGSVSAHIALSYSCQAGFDLERARESLENAVHLAPDNALVWARLAELHLSFGALDDALEAAQKAAALAPELSRTQTVLGFAYLTQVKTAEARAAFDKAVVLDQADPLPRLGLGLAKIRDGDLSSGRTEIEVAAGLDPNNAIVRSYLGKAYYEEKAAPLDAREYAAAKALDPEDPTPWFYDAIRKQTLNQPVAALKDLEKAKALNNNRAVYRSRLLLDADLAARSASLARIYGDLGFQQLALNEGYASVNTDPSNFSAHRFLADSYSALPRHEIARVSELLQSQLLQPNNITPIQPRLSESNLFLISAAGSSELSFNEFNPLFNRDRAAVQINATVAENDTYGAEGIVSGIYGRWSFSGGYTRFDTDGFRTNNDQTDDIGNAFVQCELSHKTSIQAEYRYRDTEKGETQLRFFEDDYRPNLRQETTTKTGRLGIRHAVSPSSIFLGNFSYQDLADRELDEPENPVFLSAAIDAQTDQKSYGAELQHVFKSLRFQTVAGAGYFDISGKDDIFTEFVLPPPPFPPGLPPVVAQDNTEVDRDARHTNVYLYSYLHLPKRITLTLGGSGDFFSADDEATQDTDQFNPKLGVTWNPLPGTTLRAAAFRTLKRTLVTDQTLEPTQVAGFNQFFDDENATDAWRYGGAVDQKFSESLFAGVEYSYRDLDVPFFDTTANREKTVDWDERLLRTYLYWAPLNTASLTVEYMFEKAERDQTFAAGAKQVETHYVPLGIHFFHPSGVSASVKGTYVDQEGEFERQGSLGTFESGSDRFWLFDASLSCRLPKRYGFLTVGVQNLSDEQFQYYDTDPDNPRLNPGRTVYGRVTIALP